MLGSQWAVKGKQRDEAEKPFWISYADLMTALMMLFLIVMCVSLMTMINAQEGPEKERNEVINTIMSGIKDDIKNNSDFNENDAEVNIEQRLISFGAQAQFGLNDASVSNAKARHIRRFLPTILKRINDTPLADKWFKRVTIEGYASREGTYFGNMDLSLRRSRNVLCALLNRAESGETPLTEEQKRQIRNIFMVGGFSANSTTGDPLRDRRVEFRLEFWTVQEQKEGTAQQPDDLFDQMDVGACQQQ